MTPEDAKKEIARLSEEIEHHNQLYYQQSKTEISDYEFDKMLEKLIELEGKFPELSFPLPHHSELVVLSQRNLKV